MTLIRFLMQVVGDLWFGWKRTFRGEGNWWRLRFRHLASAWCGALVLRALSGLRGWSQQLIQLPKRDP